MMVDGELKGVRDAMTDKADRLYERILVLRCQTGDEEAFAELVQRYRPRLLYYLRKMLREFHRAEDALQEVWLDVLRAIKRLKDAGAFRAWVYRIARDRAYRELRKSHLRTQRLERVEAIDESAEDAEFTPEDAAQIHAALDELSAEHREVAVLQFIECMSYEEIAGIVGCPIGTVRSRLHYAKRSLRAALERMRIDE
jgi:RNA polymerase sigma-70 factor, ECF subfamily